MKRLADLYGALDASTSTEAKVAAVVAYLAQAPADDAAWAVYLLAGGRPRQTVPTAVLRQAATAAAGLPDWLFEASYQAVGDLAETIAHILPPARPGTALGLAGWMTTRLLPLRGQAPAEQAQALQGWWAQLPPAERFMLVKLIGGGFRVGVSKLLVQRALARHAGIDAKRVAQRMMGFTDAGRVPQAQDLARLLAADDGADDGAGSQAADSAQPYPFFLAHAPDLQGLPLPQRLGDRADWLAEWKFDGIRAQLVCRAGAVWIWSRGEELVTESFPEVAAQARALPAGTVLDGELLVWRDGAPAAFSALQQRLGRKTVSRRLQAELPVVFMAYDLLQADGLDLRARPQHERRQRLEHCVAGTDLLLSPLLSEPDWDGLAALRQTARSRGVEGLMLKHRLSGYGSGRTKSDGIWWKWKVDALTIDAVLTYAQAGHGRRAGVYTDYTFALWNRPPRDAAEAAAVAQAIADRQPPDPHGLQLVTIAKAYSGLSDAEFAQADRHIRAHTLEKFGPVRGVRPALVFELAFDAVQPSSRHRSGWALRFPRMLRIRADKPLHEADALPVLAAMIGRDKATDPGVEGG